jgi:starvation-inducible DNA-binding protein
MYKTKNDLPESVRKPVIELLNARLADSIDIVLQSKQAHWNVKGPNFIALHELFDKISEEAEEYVDTIAERVTTLGGIAEGTVQAVSKRTQLKEYPTSAASGLAHVDALSSALAQFGKSVRSAIDQADEHHDKDTADLFTGISRSVDKYVWFLEAHLQGDR